MLAELRAAAIEPSHYRSTKPANSVREGLRYLGLTRQPYHCLRCQLRYEVEQMPGTPERETTCPRCATVLT